MKFISYKEYTIQNDEYYLNLLLQESLNESLDFTKITNLLNKISDKKAAAQKLINQFNKEHNFTTKKYIITILIFLFSMNMINKNSVLSNTGPAQKIKIEQAAEKLSKSNQINIKEVKNVASSLINPKAIRDIKGETKKDIAIKVININSAKTSQEGIDLIKYHEELHLTAYVNRYKVKDKKTGEIKEKSDGMITIGWGHAEPATSANYKEGDKITKEQAEELFKGDLSLAEKGVKRMLLDWQEKGIKPKITQGMFDAMVSMAFNMGVSKFRQTQFAQQLRKKDYKGAADSIKTTSVSKKFPGLKSRREKEHGLFVKYIKSLL